MQKKKRKKWPFILVAVIAVVIIVPMIMIQSAQKAISEMVVYEAYTVNTGDLIKTVSGSGVLGAKDTQMLKAPMGTYIEKMVASVGDTLKAGDIIAQIDLKKLNECIAQKEKDISALEKTLNTQSNSASENFNSSMEGRVKEIFAKEGQSADACVAENGSLMVLSTDGKMKIDFTSSKELETGSEVSVRFEESGRYTGTVVAKNNNDITVTFTDDGPKLNEQAEIYKNDELIGRGKAQINAPANIVGGGKTIKDIRVDVNDKVYSGTALIKFYEKQQTNDYKLTAISIEEQTGYLKTLYDYKEKGGVTASEAGVVAKILYDNTTAMQSTENTVDLVELNIGGASKLSVDIDELDIGNIALGQSASVFVEAMSNENLRAKVSEISAVGNEANGITGYPVTLELENTEKLFTGMNATATIEVNQVNNVLLVPREYVFEDKEGAYVLVSASGDFKGGDIIKTTVKTGISDGINIEITKGLNVGDIVMKKIEQTSDLRSMGFMPPMPNEIERMNGQGGATDGQ